ncbi:DUF4365 domain-containing protein [Hwanghaeella sp.]|uniref:DUF4365 domain-containing protein n=1 Tax=Hwanghaeella sp. TaxID=2605943 RepID=UPI003CCBF4CA
MTKTITDPQIIGAQGEAFVSERANSMGFMYSSYGRVEAGIDGLLEIRDPKTSIATGRLVSVQVKTRKVGKYTGETDDKFEYLMDKEDVEYWTNGSLPTIVVLVHLERGIAYWQSVDSGTGPDARRLTIDKESDVFDRRAADRIAALCVEKSGFGVWFPAMRGEEDGYLNLLKVRFDCPVFLARSPFKSGRAALYELLKHDQRPPNDWVIRGGQFMSFRDPSTQPLRHIVDTGTVEQFPADQVLFPQEESEEHIVIDLLRRTLIAQMDDTLHFRKSRNALYFPASPGRLSRTFSYRSFKNYTSANVVSRYEKDGALKYVRHHAFEPRFWLIGGEWHLSITPTFVFTWDGYKPDIFEAGRLAGKKKRERNAALAGQFIMWRYLMTENEDAANDELFDFGSRSNRPLKFEALEPLELPQSVPDDVWRQSEPVAVDDDQGRFAL